MGRPLSEWRTRIHELLADGEWHEQESVVRDAMRLVPPGPAYRHAEQARSRLSPGRPRVRGDESDAIATGQRQMTMQSLHAAIRFNKVHRKKENGIYYLRDPNASTMPSAWSESDDLAEELYRQLQFWQHALKVLPPGEVRDVILGGDPVQSIRETLVRNNRTTDETRTNRAQP